MIKPSKFHAAAISLIACIFSAQSIAETTTFTAKVQHAYVFTSKYHLSHFRNTIQIQFEGTPINLPGCNPNHVVISSQSDTEVNGSALYSTVLAAMMSGKPLWVSINNESPFNGDHCNVRWLTIKP